MKKRMLSLALACALALSLAVPVSAATESQVTQTIQALGIMQGDETGDLALGRNVTRAEFAKMLVAASSYKDTVSQSGSGYSLFKDVKSSYWASEYIYVALQNGWMTGYTDQTFRPGKTITIEEACSALLNLLGYDASTLGGSYPQAQLSKASALGLRDQVSAAQGTALSRRACMYLFYNLLTAENSQGQTYAAALGYTVTNGEVDYTAVLMDSLSGPYVAQSASPTLPFTPATVYRNGEVSSSSAISQYDVYYYNTGLKTLWIYTNRVSGKVTEISPSTTAPTAVTVAGVSYSLGSTEAVYQFSALGGSTTGTIVTLLLGMDDAVVDVLTGTAIDTTYYGVVTASSKSASTDATPAVVTNVEVACTDGVTRTFSVEKDTTYSAGRLVSVQVTGGEISVKTLTEKSTSGRVNRSATSLGDLDFADDIEILDTSKEGDAVVIEPERLAGQTLSSSYVRYYALDQKGDIAYLILNDATGDTWQYGYMISAKESDSADSMSVSASYTYIVDGTTSTLNTNNLSYGVKSGGLAIRYQQDGSIKSMKNTKRVTLTSLSALTATAENKTYDLADGVQVYLQKSGSCYSVNLSDIDAENYTLTGYYDDFGCPAGGQIRVIIAVKK